MNYFSQHGYIVSALIRMAASLAITIHFAVFPLTMYLFQEVPIIGLFCNLFFPIAITPAMVLLLMGVVIPFVGVWFVKVGAWYAGWWLDMIVWGMDKAVISVVWAGMERWMIVVVAD